MPETSRDHGLARFAPLIAASACATTLLIIAYRQGPAIAPDSIDYLSAGLNMAQGRGVVTFDGSALTSFPPLLPALIALGEMIGVSGTQTAAAINLAAILITVGGVFLLLRWRVSNPTIVWVGTMIVAVTPALFDSLRYLSTDPLFVAFVVVWLCIADRITNVNYAHWVPVIALGIVGGLSIFLRYAGVTVIISGAIILLLQRDRLSRSFYGKITAYLAISSIAPALWLLRNHSVSGTWMGPRAPANISPVEIVRRMVSTLGSWLLPLPPGNLTLAAFVLALIGVVILMKLGTSAPAYRPSWVKILSDPLTVFAIVYVSYLAVAAWRTAFDPIGVRLLSPVFVPALVLSLEWLDRSAIRIPKSSRKWKLVLVGALLFVSSHAIVSAAKANRVGAQGNGFTLIEFRDGPLSTLVSSLDDAAIVSNNGRAVWSLRREGDVQEIPRAVWFQRSDKYELAVSDMIDTITCHEGLVYLVVWAGEPRTGLDEPAVAEALSRTVVSDTSQGTLEVISPTQTSGSCEDESETPR